MIFVCGHSLEDERDADYGGHGCWVKVEDGMRAGDGGGGPFQARVSITAADDGADGLGTRRSRQWSLRVSTAGGFRSFLGGCFRAWWRSGNWPRDRLHFF